MLTIREYESVYRADKTESYKNCLPEKSFDWLVNYAGHDYKDEEGDSLSFLSYNHLRRSIKFKNFVGLIQTPDDSQIEILPKISDADINTTRSTLLKMLKAYLSRYAIYFKTADIRRQKANLLEVFIFQFLSQVSHMVKRGMRRDYIEVTENLNYYRGRMNVAGQIRHNLVHRERFYMTHDEYSPDRAENRLVLSALQKVMKISRDIENQKLIRELYYNFADVAPSTNYRADLISWSNQRNMQHYGSLKLWCRMLLSDQGPISVSGDINAVSLLFPMEKVFEHYVGSLLKSHSRINGYALKTQAASEYLIENHILKTGKAKQMFRLKPDFILNKNGQNCVIDAKWKTLDSTNHSEKYGISQADMYQLYAYGQKYLNGTGEIFLIYPKSDKFRQHLPAFHFNENLVLHVVPVDLNEDRILWPTVI